MPFTLTKNFFPFSVIFQQPFSGFSSKPIFYISSFHNQYTDFLNPNVNYFVFDVYNCCFRIIQITTTKLLIWLPPCLWRPKFGWRVYLEMTVLDACEDKGTKIINNSEGLGRESILMSTMLFQMRSWISMKSCSSLLTFGYYR